MIHLILATSTAAAGIQFTYNFYDTFKILLFFFCWDFITIDHIKRKHQII